MSKVKSILSRRFETGDVGERRVLLLCYAGSCFQVGTGFLRMEGFDCHIKAVKRVGTNSAFRSVQERLGAYRSV